MTDKYHIFEDGNAVHISLKDNEKFDDAFIDIFTGVDFPSIFESLEDARIFAEFIVRFLEHQEMEAKELKL